MYASAHISTVFLNTLAGTLHHFNTVRNLTYIQLYIFPTLKLFSPQLTITEDKSLFYVPIKL